jgi:adenosylcobinamide-GDP ribazoletransferase
VSLGKPLALAFGLLTRLPVRAEVTREEELGAAVAWFPAVGLAIGLALAAARALLEGHLAPGLIAALLIALSALVTGGLHLDGLADVFDGVGGGRGDRERMLAIMRDSRIGAHGAAALVLVLVAKVAALAELVPRGAGWALALAPLVARAAVMPLVLFFPYARAAGLGRAFHDYSRPRHLALGTACTLAVLSVAGRALSARSVVVEIAAPTLAALAVSLLIGVWLRARMGGLTGDVYGSAIELSELAFWVVAGARG